MTGRFLACLAAGAMFATPSIGAAQVRASERGTVSQTVDGTTITVDYGRPQARGRADTLFGGVVPWGKVWTPGANWATTLEVSKPVTLNGHALEAGTYSIWLHVQRDGWTAIFDPEPRRFHLLPPPRDGAGQVRFGVEPRAGPHTEVLTWSFPEVRPSGTALRLAWGTAVVSFDVGVRPSQPVTLARDLADRYVGSYRMETQGLLGAGTTTFDVAYDGQHLTAAWPTAPNPRLTSIWLAPLGQGMFFPVELDGGELFDVLTDVVFEFTPLDGRASRFEMRGLGDELWATGERVAGR